MGSEADPDRVRLADLPESLVEDVINSRGFQKMLAYRRLADGIEVLEDQDQLYDSMVTSITQEHSSNIATATTEEFFELFITEVRDYTEGIVDEDDTFLEQEDGPLSELMVDEGGDDGS